MGDVHGEALYDVADWVKFIQPISNKLEFQNVKNSRKMEARSEDAVTLSDLDMNVELFKSNDVDHTSRNSREYCLQTNENLQSSHCNSFLLKSLRCSTYPQHSIMSTQKRFMNLLQNEDKFREDQILKQQLVVNLEIPIPSEVINNETTTSASLSDTLSNVINSNIYEKSSGAHSKSSQVTLKKPCSAAKSYKYVKTTVKTNQKKLQVKASKEIVPRDITTKNQYGPHTLNSKVLSSKRPNWRYIFSQNSVFLPIGFINSTNLNSFKQNWYKRRRSHVLKLVCNHNNYSLRPLDTRLVKYPVIILKRTPQYLP